MLEVILNDTLLFIIGMKHVLKIISLKVNIIIEEYNDCEVDLP